MSRPLRSNTNLDSPEPQESDNFTDDQLLDYLIHAKKSSIPQTKLWSHLDELGMWQNVPVDDVSIWEAKYEFLVMYYDDAVLELHVRSLGAMGREKWPLLGKMKAIKALDRMMGMGGERERKRGEGGKRARINGSIPTPPDATLPRRGPLNRSFTPSQPAPPPSHPTLQDPISTKLSLLETMLKAQQNAEVERKADYNDRRLRLREYEASERAIRNSHETLLRSVRHSHEALLKSHMELQKRHNDFNAYSDTLEASRTESDKTRAAMVDWYDELTKGGERREKVMDEAVNLAKNEVLLTEEGRAAVACALRAKGDYRLADDWRRMKGDEDRVRKAWLRMFLISCDEGKRVELYFER